MKQTTKISKSNYKFEKLYISFGEVSSIYFYEGYITFPFSNHKARFAVWAADEETLSDILYDRFGIYSTIVFE